jgi:hypothetical protein
MRDIFLVLSALLSSVLLCAQGAVERLQDVRTICVGSLGTGEAAELVRSKVIAHLAKASRFEVVESPDRADAVLVGVSDLSETPYYSASSGGLGVPARASAGTISRATAGVQLINRDKRVLWADDTSSRASSRSASSSLADRIVKDLLKAMAKEERRK